MGGDLNWPKINLSIFLSRRPSNCCNQTILTSKLVRTAIPTLNYVAAPIDVFDKLISVGILPVLLTVLRNFWGSQVTRR